MIVIGNLFGLDVYLYGLVMALAAALCLTLATFSAYRQHVSLDAVSWFAVLAVPLGVLFGRLGYCLSRWEWFFQEDLLTFFRLQDGGLMLYGAMAGAGIAAVLAARLSHSSLPRLADVLAAPAALMIAIMRLAEGPLAQGFGWPLVDWFDAEMGMSIFHPEEYDWLQRFPFAMLDSYEEWVWAVYVFEAVVALAIAAVLVMTTVRRPGWKALLFLLLYAATQVLCESMRNDELLKWGFVRVNQLVCAVVAAGVLLVCCLRLRTRNAKRQIIASWCGLIASMGVVIAAEFMLEKKIVFLEWIPNDMCYLIMAAACTGMALSVLPVWKKSMEG